MSWKRLASVFLAFVCALTVMTIGATQANATTCFKVDSTRWYCKNGFVSGDCRVGQQFMGVKNTYNIANYYHVYISGSGTRIVCINPGNIQYWDRAAYKAELWARSGRDANSLDSLYATRNQVVASLHWLCQDPCAYYRAPLEGWNE